VSVLVLVCLCWFGVSVLVLVCLCWFWCVCAGFGVSVLVLVCLCWFGVSVLVLVCLPKYVMSKCVRFTEAYITCEVATKCLVWKWFPMFRIIVVPASSRFKGLGILLALLYS
jgi:hypothetical protein